MPIGDRCSATEKFSHTIGAQGSTPWLPASPLFMTNYVNKPAQASSHVLPAAWIVTAIFFLSNAVTPLYVRWQSALQFSSTTLTLIFNAYILALLATLLVAGQLSDHFGRRFVLVPGIIAALIACVLFATATSVADILAARFLSGLAVGAAVSAGMAAVVDLAAPSQRKKAALSASIAMVLGAGLGPLMAGIFIQSFAAPVLPIFVVEAIVLLTALVIVIRLPMKARKPSARLQLRWPTVPVANRRQVAAGIATFGPGLTTTSFVLALGPTLLSTLLGAGSPLLSGGMACAMFLTAVAAQLVFGRCEVRTLFAGSALFTCLAATCLIASILLSSASALVIAALLAGAGQGLGQLGGLTLIGLNVPQEMRAQSNAILNMGAYIQAAGLLLISGAAIDAIGLTLGATVFAGVIAVFAAIGGMWAVRETGRGR